MTPSFQLVGIRHEPFEPPFLLSEDQLKQHGAQRHIATESPGCPCRISLEDASVGDELLLLTYLHQPAASPYRASGPIFVRRSTRQRRLDAGEAPSYVTRRLMSVRAYDAAHLIVAASVCDGVLTAQELLKYFSDDQVEYIHFAQCRSRVFLLSSHSRLATTAAPYTTSQAVRFRRFAQVKR